MGPRKVALLSGIHCSYFLYARYLSDEAVKSRIPTEIFCHKGMERTDKRKKWKRKWFLKHMQKNLVTFPTNNTILLQLIEKSGCWNHSTGKYLLKFCNLLHLIVTIPKQNKNRLCSMSRDGIWTLSWDIRTIFRILNEIGCRTFLF